MKPNDFDSVTAVIQSYFDGLYHGDVTKLQSIFHHDVCLKAPGVRRTMAQWLMDVENRPIPAQQEQAYGFKILAVDVVQDQAMVKVQCPLFEFNYVDFIGLLKEDDHWLIVSKMYTDIKF